jgi:hypothetical protein
MSIQTDIEKIREAKRAYQELIRSIGTSSIKTMCEEVLAATGSPKVRWMQYTPYFNDGEPCEFSVYEPEIYFPDHPKGYGGDWVESCAFYESVDYDRTKAYGDPTRATFTYKDAQQEASHKVFRAFSLAIQQDLQEVMREAFGDHVSVTYEGGQFTVEDYDHD